MRWTTLHLQVTTPLFNGDADPAVAGDTGVRAPSMRGAMRFWFRAFAGLAAGPDLRLLAALERRVFGGSATASPVKLRIPAQPPVSPPGTPDFLRDHQAGRWIGYLLGQGLYKVENRQHRVLRPYVAPGETFELQLRFTGPEEASALAVASLWLLCAYGGLGARARRGFGGLRIVGAEGPLPAPWDSASILTPGLDHYEGLTCLWPDGVLGECVRHLKKAVEAEGEKFQVAWKAERPTYPVLHKGHTKARTSGGKVFQDWAHVLEHAGEQLRWFRAGEDWPGVPYEPKIKTPEWTQTITGPGNRFGLGALGLPVVYRGNLVVNADSGEEKAERLRRASPLWLRPVGDDEEGWRLLSFAFLGEFLPGPDAPAVHLWHGTRQGKPLKITHDDVVRRVTDWIGTMARDGSFIRTSLDP